MEPNQVYEWTGNTNDTTNCIAGIYEINGNKKPNAFGKDINSFNGAGLGFACDGIKKNNICFHRVDNYSAVNCGRGGDATYCTMINSFTTDYFAGAKKACDLIGMRLPSLAELQTLCQDSVKDSPIYGEIYWTNYAYTNLNSFAIDGSTCQQKQVNNQDKYKVLCVEK